MAALVYNPVSDELFTAERGSGAFVNDRRVRVAARSRLADCVITCGIPHSGRGDHDLGLAELHAVMGQVAGIRRTGSAALDLAFVAAGRCDGFFEHGLAPWDLAAGTLLVREAGGYVTDIAGKSEVLASGDVVAGNEAIHNDLLKLLKKAGAGAR